ncbi:MAG TPA: hypothetical protein VFM46_02845, partial [Pseudomonadales bacterium]|nr:hypothetical protein [Pseudomonadales bacterium]
ALSGCGAADSEGDTNHNGKVDFGEWGPMPANLQLRSVVNAGTTTTLSTQVTALTELATAFAAVFPQGIDSLSYQVAASQTSNLLGLSANLSGLTPIDLTNASSVAGADINTLLYSLLSAALLDVASGNDFEQFFGDMKTQFVAQQGQLIGHDASDGSVTLNAIFAKAMALAQHLGLNGAYSQLAAMKAKYLALAGGELSTATPSSTIANDKLTKAKTLVNDLDKWRDYLVLGSEPVQSAPEADLMGTELAPEFQKMLRSLAVAGQFGVLGAVPSVAINDYCGKQSALLSMLCFQLAQNLQESCAAILSTQPNGQLFCNALNNLPIPASFNLVVTYHLLDKYVDIKGQLKGYDLNLRVTIGQIGTQDVNLSISGKVTAGTNVLTIRSGTIALHFADTIDLSHLKLPSKAHLTFNGRYVETSETYGQVTFNGQFDSNIDLTRLNKTGTAFNDLDTDSLSVLSNLPFDMTASGKVSTSAGLLFDTTLSLINSTSDQITLSYKDASGVEYTQFGDADSFQSNLPNLRVTENGETTSLTRSDANPRSLTLSNQDGVTLKINLDAADGARAGSLTVQGQTYGVVTRDGDHFVVQFGDLSTYSLQSAGTSN